jgi:hypothetical protein
MYKHNITFFKNDQYHKHDYYVINIKEVDWGTLQWVLNYHNILFNAQLKEITFALFIKIAILFFDLDLFGLCFVVGRQFLI